MMKKSEKILREHPVNKKRVAEGKNTPLCLIGFLQ
jgi:2,3-bisphosphoglycerate-independent phosphoglycerate mutase